jgi:hypothetical protein
MVESNTMEGEYLYKMENDAKLDGQAKKVASHV